MEDTLFYPLKFRAKLMLSKYYTLIVTFISLMQNSETLLAEPSPLDKIKENSFRSIAEEKLRNEAFLKKINVLLADTKKQIETEEHLIDKTRSELKKYKNSKHDDLFFPPKTISLGQNLNLLNKSYLIKNSAMSSDIISISNRIFLSEGHYATDRTGNELISDSKIKSNKIIEKNAYEFNPASHEEQPLGVIIGYKPDSTPTKTNQNKTVSISLLEFIKQGGLVGGIIILSGLIVVILGILNYRALHKFNQLFEDPESVRNAVFGEFESKENNQNNLEQNELLLSKILHEQSTNLRGTIDYIRFIATISPMLGLLGTVSGLVITFQAFNLSGSNESTIVAAGISKALTTTILGLIVAVPSLLLFTLLSSKAKSTEEGLEQIAFEIMLNLNDK